MSSTNLSVAADARPSSTAEEAAWWRTAVAYQVYPRSFADSDGDGVGDLRGLIDRLDHIAELGIDVIWLSPVYRSPQDDNGYDISDYQDVDPEFGTLADVDELIAAVHERGMRLIMDLVVNHTSDEHPWFVASRSGRTGPYADWYIWRDPRPGHRGGTPGAEPTNWGSFFSGSAWTYVPERDQYYLHLFSRKQPDLNWENPEVRSAIHQMMNWWLDRGIDGFRMDVINYISKVTPFTDGPAGPDGWSSPVPWCGYGPRIHEFLAEMQRAVFASRNGVYLTVGEMPGVTVEQALRFTDAETGQLCMVFQFEHMDLDHGVHKFAPRDAGVRELRASLARWQEGLGERGWNSLYWSNHDQPRPVSRFGDPERYWRESATALATVLHLHRGTPFIFQGEEIGMTNAPLAGPDDLRDIESVRYYEQAVHGLGLDPEEVLAALRRKSRDNARTPMQWDAGPNAGFTTGTPWIGVNPNYPTINVEQQRNDPNSIYSYYRRLIALRHREPALTSGTFELLLPNDPDIYAYLRRGADDTILVCANLSGAPRRVEYPWGEAETLLANQSAGGNVFQPWEARVVRAVPGAELRVPAGGEGEVPGV